MRLQGKVALVTGSASGIGKAIAKLFASEGAKVIVSDIKEDQNSQTVAEIKAEGGEASYVKLNVTNEVDWANAAKFAADTYGSLNILVNCAGIASQQCKFPNVDKKMWQLYLDVNLTGPMIGIETCAPLMRNIGGGTIVNIASLAGLYGTAGNTGYSTSKAALIELSNCAAAEFAAWGIRCNTICPGWINSTGLTAMPEGFTWVNPLVEYAPLGRGGETYELANAALFLASDESSYITGHTIPVDGGLHCVGAYAVACKQTADLEKLSGMKAEQK